MFDPKQRSFFELFNLSLQCLISKIKCLFRILKSSCQSAPHKSAPHIEDRSGDPIHLQRLIEDLEK